jgi:hypothetical protein
MLVMFFTLPIERSRKATLRKPDIAGAEIRKRWWLSQLFRGQLRLAVEAGARIRRKDASPGFGSSITAKPIAVAASMAAESKDSEAAARHGRTRHKIQSRSGTLILKPHTVKMMAVLFGSHAEGRRC